MRPTPLPAGPDQESVWDYPRPPRIESTPRRLQIGLRGHTVADTHNGQRVLETSHPPTYYFPPESIDRSLLRRSAKRSFCEWKGQAVYWDVVLGETVLEAVGWSYPDPTPGCGLAPGSFAFYAAPFDTVTVDGEPVTPQPGGFYGGRITSHVVGPFKGIAGSWGW